jgi:hypothetical protein
MPSARKATAIELLMHNAHGYRIARILPSTPVRSLYLTGLEAAKLGYCNTHF